MFVPECFPGVVSVNTGIPIAPFGWAGQVKYSYKLTKKTTLSFTAYKPREFAEANVNPADVTNAASLNAALPQLNLHLQFKGDKLLVGGQMEYGSVKPYVKYEVAPNICTSNEAVNAITFMAYKKLPQKKWGLKHKLCLDKTQTIG